MVYEEFCYKLCEIYLINRKQYVCINNNISSLQEIKSGIQQWSVLGHTFPSIY